MHGLTIGRLARRAGVNVETIRFYERIGLIDEPPRTPSGYRIYDDADVDRIRFIRKAKELGFTLDEIAELLALRVRRTASCGAVRRAAEAKIDDIARRIRALARMKRTLAKLVRSCERQETTGDCPILAALESHERASRSQRSRGGVSSR